MILQFQVRNRTRATVLGDAIWRANRSGERNRGLLGRKSLKVGEGLWIVPCEAVHTFFMKFAIDAIYVDRAKRVRKVVNHLRPWRISVCVTAHSVIELPAGTAQSTGTQPGDSLEMIPCAA